MRIDVSVRRLAILLPLLCGVLAVGTQHANAQASLGQRAVGGGPVGGGGGPKAKEPAPAPASALPGEAAGSDRVIPSDHSASDMSPTDALFDAVVRGDLTAARDSIARGADFTAHNELGQTPLDESIDLGRNNITFLLLSLRGGPNDSGSGAPVVGAGKGSGAATLKAAAKPSTPQAAAKPAPVQTSTAASTPASGNPGTPNPQRGFLGFGG